MSPLYSFCVFSFILSTISVGIISAASSCKGCVNLDEFNFDKVVPRFETVLVKFDVSYPYGEKHDVFSSIASEIVDNKNIILAQVGVKDYGDNENQEFAKKFGVLTKQQLPALRLFVQGEDEPFAFEQNLPWNEENLRKFIRDHSSIYLGLPGCLEAFDKLAIKFTNSNDKEAVLKETERATNKLSNDREKTIANTYVKFMKKVLENGTSFVHQEESRLAKIVKEGKVTEQKKTELSHRLNILKSFTKPGKTEL